MKVLKFLIAGGAGVLLYYIALYTLTEFLGFWYVVSAIIGFFCNHALNFTLQKYWTFKNTSTDSVWSQIWKYFLMRVGFLIGNTLCLWLLVKFVNLHYLVAQGILTFILSIIGFYTSKKIFEKETPHT